MQVGKWRSNKVGSHESKGEQPWARSNDAFQETFRQVKAIFKPYAAKLYVVHDTDTNFYLTLIR